MALSITEMNYLQQGVVRPLGISLLDLMKFTALRHAQYLKDTEKVVPPENTEATNCLNKQNGLASNIFSSNSGTLQSLLTRMILKFGNTTNFADLRTNTDAQWETLFGNNIPEVFDDVAGITDAERTAYNAI
jgi:hypothetical protein